MKWMGVFILSVATLLMGCDQAEDGRQISSPVELNRPGMVIGVPQGAASMTVAERMFPEATIKYYGPALDGYTAVAHKKIDAFVFDRQNMCYATRQQAELVLLDEGLRSIEIVVGVGKRHPEDLVKEVNAFIAAYQADGTFERMYEHWLLKGDLTPVDVPPAEHPTRHFVVAMEGLCEPFNFFAAEGKLTGFDVEFAYRLAKALNASIEFVTGDFAGMVAGAQSGKVDLLISNLNATPERAEQMWMSQPYMMSEIAVMVHKDRAAKRAIRSIGDMKGRKGAYPTGTAFMDLTAPYCPGIEWLTFNDLPSCLQALLVGKVEGTFMDEPVAKLSVSKYPEALQIAHVYAYGEYGFAFRKGGTLQESVNGVIRQLSASGELDALKTKWCEGAPEGKVLEDYTFNAKNGVLRYACDPVLEPMVYIGESGKVIGLEIDLVRRIAHELEMGIEITQLSFAALIEALLGERVDMVGSAISITEERKQRVDFSETYYKGGLTLLTRKEAQRSAVDAQSFWGALKESFERTFVREQRWKLIAEGLGVTLTITIFAAFLGTLLAFGICAMRRSTQPLVAAIGKMYIALIQGTPILVILMILYYIVFAKWDIHAAFIAILGFALNFAAYVGEMFRTGIEGIPRGQNEAASALGFTRFAAFRKVIFPQVLLRILPIYRGEFINMLKTTSIVGYIAIQDLTKMSDIIRSRTYEAFFPLIATAIIYFAIAHVMTWFLVAVEARLNPLNRRLKQKRLVAKMGGRQ